MMDDATKIDVKRGVDCIGVTCIFLCHDGNKRVLLHKRSVNCRDEHGRWDCGGGALEFGEEFERRCGGRFLKSIVPWLAKLRISPRIIFSENMRELRRIGSRSRLRFVSILQK